LIECFKQEATKITNVKFMDSNSAIQGIVTGDNFKTKELTAHLQSKGFFVKAILSPTVPAGTERIRICLHTFNTIQQINELLYEVNNFTA